MSYITGIDRCQINIITTSLDDLIDQNNPVRVIDAYVNSLNLKELGFIEYNGLNKGQSPYRRSDLLKLHIYGYINKIRSSRALEIEAKRNIELMWLISGITPDHGTIAGFVKSNKHVFHTLLRNLTLILKGWGLIDGKLMAIDGTKIKAQNSRHNCITKKGLSRKIEHAEEQINAYLSALEQNDSSNCEDLKEKLEKYQDLKNEYEQQKQELIDNKVEQKTLIDTDAKRMKNNHSVDICYNVQSIVDAKNHFVVDISTTNDINDLNQLYVMTKRATELLNLGSSSPMILADTGYYNGNDILRCVEDGIDLVIKKQRANTKGSRDLLKNEFRKEKFIFDSKQNCYICPMGKTLPFSENCTDSGLKYRRYRCSECNSCSSKKYCTSSTRGRTVQRWEHENVLEKVAENTKKNNEIYKQRRSIVEHPFGTIKRSLGYTYFLRRRIENVDAEASSMFIAYNFKRLFAMFSVKELIEKLS